MLSTIATATALAATKTGRAQMEGVSKQLLGLQRVLPQKILPLLGLQKVLPQKTLPLLGQKRIVQSAGLTTEPWVATFSQQTGLDSHGLRLSSTVRSRMASLLNPRLQNNLSLSQAW